MSAEPVDFSCTEINIWYNVRRYFAEFASKISRMAF